MPQLRQLAIAAEDPRKLAAFYQEVFDLETIGGDEGTVLLSDGSRICAHRFRYGAR